MQGRDRNNSQPVRAMDVLGREASVEDEAPTGDPEQSMYTLLQRKLDGTNRALGELLEALHDIRDQGHVERSTLEVLKDLRTHVRKLGETAGVNESVMFAVQEVRDVVRENTSELRRVAEGIDALVRIMTVAFGNGHT